LQGDKEREHGIPVSPLCERSGGVSNVKSTPKSKIII